MLSGKDVTPDNLRKALASSGITSVDELIDKAFATGAKGAGQLPEDNWWGLVSGDKWFIAGPD
jgi:hypothetical protein